MKTKEIPEIVLDTLNPCNFGLLLSQDQNDVLFYTGEKLVADHGSISAGLEEILTGVSGNSFDLIYFEQGSFVKIVLC